MAAIALPILALGGIYIYSNSYKNNNKENKDKKDKKEGYQNLNRGTTLTNTTLQDINYPTESKTINLNNENSVRQYNPSQTNNVFFNRPNATSNATDGIKSLSGELLSDKEFTHKNMVPFFGSKVTQNSVENTPYMLAVSYTHLTLPTIYSV